MSEALKAAILGLVQGVSEFLPISSSAHLLALHEVLDFKEEPIAFDLAVHVATLAAVLIYFRREIRLVLGAPNRWGILLRISLATVPIVLVGFLGKDLREQAPAWTPVVGWAISGTYLLLLGRAQGGTHAYADAPWKVALGIGVAQALAIFPGMSRSGTTITAGIWCGLSRDESARFSFLLSIVAVVLASALKAKDFVTQGSTPPGLWTAVAVGMPVAFVTGLFAIHLLLRVVRGAVFHRFGWYNLLMAVVYGAYLFS